ncbi:hypothetical protein JX265_000588 [Neoarthrinium moseri]|uniref:Uncharacterized protein n=1 Tax=Neoarthrinium moseri TaxID=1658444 RepID=A0A9Q0AWE8_9PEZI|nr:hypothetical protein JX266_001325 [Neoarthrinium moseri]KAI1881762.1 hypothetical protein JX265_000588 [Neoarthrinium moseri]
MTAGQALQAGEIATSIDKVTDISSKTNNIATGISMFNLQQTTPQVVGNFGQIINQLSALVSGLNAMESPKGQSSGSSPFSEADQQKIYEALTTFVKVHQQSLSTLIGKQGIISMTPYSVTISAALRSSESVIDSLAYAIIGLVPTYADKAKTEKSSLEATLAQSISAYN